MWEKLREWYILIIGICLIAAGFFLASHPSSSTAPPPTQTAQAPHQAPPARPLATSAKAEHNPSPMLPKAGPEGPDAAPGLFALAAGRSMMMGVRQEKSPPR